MCESKSGNEGDIVIRMTGDRALATAGVI